MPRSKDFCVEKNSKANNLPLVTFIIKYKILMFGIVKYIENIDRSLCFLCNNNNNVGYSKDLRGRPYTT